MPRRGGGRGSPPSGTELADPKTPLGAQRPPARNGTGVQALAQPAVKFDASHGRAPGSFPIVLVGPPNVGKSALFAALTRRYTTVANYPGTTVELSRSRLAGAEDREVVDTPGVLSLLPFSEEERVTRDLLWDGSAVVLLVGDAKNLERVLFLALQLAEMHLPMVLCLNMADEAAERGIFVDAAALGARLGVDVVPTVAVRGRGIGQLRAALSRARPARPLTAYPPELERILERVAAWLPEDLPGARGWALAILAGDDTLARRLRERVSHEALRAIETLRRKARDLGPEPLSYRIAGAQFRCARELAEAVTRRSRRGARPGPRSLRALETLAVHPWAGLPLLAAVLYLTYLFVGRFGAGTLVDWMEGGLFERWINPWAVAAVERVVPWGWVRDMLVGPYGLVTMALTYALALILPIVATFFVAFGILEDTGYLPRLAVLVHRIFRRMGLHGKAVLPMVLGLGCDTMATLTTRILETPKERLIVILLLALGVPCSAQLSVILAMLAGLSAAAMLIWAGVIVGVIFAVGALASRVIPGRTGDFIVELPPLRVPVLSNILAKTLARIEWYLREAVPLFVLGTLVLFALDRTGALGGLERAAVPLVRGWLELPPQAAGAFLVGFLRRDFGAAGLYAMAREGMLDARQVLVAAVTITLFLPCVANYFVIMKERGWKVASAVAGFAFAMAFLVGGLLARTLAWLGWRAL